MDICVLGGGEGEGEVAAGRWEGRGRRGQSEKEDKMVEEGNRRTTKVNNGRHLLR